jgi:antitoxin component of MazEF toxin-antitoxin module
MIRKIVTTGRSSAVTIDKAFLEILNLKNGDSVDVTLNLNGEIVIKPVLHDVKLNKKKNK